MTHSEAAHKQGWTKGTNCYSWSFRNNISAVRESQHNCRLLGEAEENHKRQVEATLYNLYINDTPQTSGVNIEWTKYCFPK
jgi:hypothetical protein